MVNLIHIEEALKSTNSIFIDVRSPSEYNDATIPGSINIPILNDEERAEVGQTYRHKSKEEAKLLGLHYASSKLTDFYSSILKLKEKHDHLIFFCWRGGLRSKSICNILNMLGIKTIYQLAGGYKAYRKFVLDYINSDLIKFKFITIHGLTGVGKTNILYKLEKDDIPTVNLEDLAKNSGSVFGNIFFQEDSPSQKQFESLLFNKLFFNNERYTALESESKRIGKVNIPNPFFDKMKDGYHILVNTNMRNRVENIYESYIKLQSDADPQIINSISHLKKRLGTETVNQLKDKIRNKDYYYVIEYLINNYYDPLYEYSINKIDNYDLVINYDKIDDAVNEIKLFIKNNL